MEIKIQVIHRSELVIVEETFVIPAETYDHYSYPEDVIQAKIQEMRERVTKQIPFAEARSKESKEKIPIKSLNP
jgi:hypothetical protein